MAEMFNLGGPKIRDALALGQLLIVGSILTGWFVDLRTRNNEIVSLTIAIKEIQSKVIEIDRELAVVREHIYRDGK